MSTDKCVLNKRQIYSPLGLTSATTLYVRRSLAPLSLLIISSRDCREADSRDTSPRHACLGEVSRKIWLHNFAINNNGGSVPVIFISLGPAKTNFALLYELSCHSFLSLHFLTSQLLKRINFMISVKSVFLEKLSI